MSVQNTLVAVAAVAMLAVSGCAVTRGQQSVGEYVDDTAITTAVKAKHAQSGDVAATSIGVETLNGTVMLSGFATSASEKSMAESLAREVKGVKSVENQIVVRRP
ncbi:MAG: BON domain-containing protein [Gammaproteobacteria bacterium]|jgi:hyperosmotically inducible protein|nr:BON domain-containing protein [Gammaproteobacteria bacterium]